MGRKIPLEERREKGDHRYTDHAAEVQAFRDTALTIVKAYPDVEQAPDEKRKDAAILMAAAALLEVHDDTGISLDDWVGPLELVYEALWLIGKDREDFVPNHV